MPKIKTHHIYSGIQLIFLLGILMFSAILFNRTGDDFFLFLIICFVSGFYIIWGMWHHYVIDHVNKEVIIEYILDAILIIIISEAGLGIIRFF